jgi:AraC family transcriptional regulator, transcriptional activator of pobA
MAKKIQYIPVRQINENFTNFQTMKDFAIRSLTDIFKLQDISEPIHRHDFYYILFLKQGKGKHIIDFEEFPIIENSLYIVKPGQSHALTLDNESVGYVLMFQRNFYLSENPDSNRLLFLKNTMPTFLCLETKNALLIENLFEELIAESKQNSQERKTVLRAYLDIFLAKLTRLNQQTAKNELDMSLTEKVYILENLIDANFAKHKSVLFYAKEMVMTEKQLNTFCHKVFDKTVSQLIEIRLILEAKRLVVCTDLQIMEIAFELGFDDHTYFNRFFKRNTNLTPIEFRKSGGKIQ